MNAQTQLPDKVKSNGKWAADQAQEAGKEVSARGSELIETFRDGASSALDLAKRYPVQAAVGGIVIGLFLGAKIFGGRPS